MNDLRYCLRTFRKSPGFSAAAVMLLALGIGLDTAIFTVADSVLLRPLSYREPDRLYSLNLYPRGAEGTQAASLFDDAACADYQNAHSFSGVACYRSHPLNLTASGQPVQLPAWEVSADFFDVLGVEPQIGRTFRAEEGQAAHRRVVVLGDAVWRSRFSADPAILGRTIILDAEPYTVIGVMPGDFRFFPGRSALWIPAVSQASGPASRLAIARLNPGVSEATADAEVAGVAQRRAVTLPANDRHRNDTAELVPLQETVTEQARPLLLILMGAAGFVLLIACANTATLLLARGDARRHEFAVRASLGAGRSRLFKQLLMESALLSFAGGALGLMVSRWGRDALLAIIPAGGIPRLDEIRIDVRVVDFALLLALLTTILAGLLPALKLSKESFHAALQQGVRSVAGGSRPRQVLLVAEIALSLMLLTGAGLLVKSFIRLRSVNPGFQPENVLAMSVDLSPHEYSSAIQCRDFISRMLARIRVLNGVRSAAVINWLPFGSLQLTGNFYTGQAVNVPVVKPAVTPGYFRTMGIPILRGRDFNERDTASAPPVVIVSEAAARRAWPNDNALGKRINPTGRPEDWLTVIGVVGDVKGALGRGSAAAIYQPFAQVQWTLVLQHLSFVVRTTAKPAPIAPALRAQLFAVDGNQPVHFLETLQSRVDTSLATPRFQARLLGAFSVLGLVLAAAGTYGVISYTVVLRTRELGIRIALGALRGGILRLVLRQSLALAGAGIALGLAGSAALTGVLRRLLFGVSPLDPSIFVLVSILLAAVAAAAAVVPARRAARVDPVVVLRHE